MIAVKNNHIANLNILLKNYVLIKKEKGNSISNYDITIYY